MNVREFLDTDFDVALGWLHQGVEWWLEEIAQLVPARWRGGLLSRRRTSAWTDGQSIALPDDAASGRQIDLTLAPDLYLTRSLTLPAMRGSDLRKMVELELDRLTPFHAADVHFDVQAKGGDAARQEVEIGVLPRQTADAVLALLREKGLEAQSLRSSDGGLDFMTSIRAQGAAGLLQPRYIWSLAVFLIVLNVVVYTVRDMSRLSALQEMTASQQSVVTLARRLREKVDGENASRAALLAALSRNSPLRIVDAITRALPAGAWVQHLDWDGHRLHLTGYAPSQVDVVAALRRSAAFGPGARVKAATAAAAATPDAPHPFDVSLEIGEAKP